MKYNRLGALTVSAVSMGCWTIGGGVMWGDTEEKESLATLQAALDAGINFFDTAEGYAAGYSEQLVGKAFSTQRENVVIATKLSSQPDSREGIIAGLEKSLVNLKTDYIDLYQKHWPSRQGVSDEETLEVLHALKKQGKIREIGVCNFGSRQLESIPGDILLVSNQLPYSLLWRALETEILPACRNRQMGILTYSTLMHGLLSGKYKSAEEMPEGRLRTRHFSAEGDIIRHGQQGYEALTFATIDRIRMIAEEAGIPMVELAYAWTLNKAGVTSVIAGARTVDQIRENARVAEIKVPGDVMTALDSATDELKTVLGPKADMWQYPGRID